MKTPKQALNKAYLKQPVIREDIKGFQKEFLLLHKNINQKQSEEFNKSLLKDFLSSTFYKQHFINTHDRTDLVIHWEKEQQSPIVVIIETKHPIDSKTEMITQNNLNQKALQQLLWYYLNQRITKKNIQLKQLIVTNAYEWFLFDAQEFEKHFAQNKNLIKAYEQFKRKELTGTATDFFYSEVAKPYIEQVKHELEYTYFNITQYDTNTPDEEWVALYKLLSPEHLLKQPFLNDSNSLDKNFYNELLYIIGLQELPQGGKDIIHRYDAKCRHSATLIEQAIDALPDTITDETIQFETAMELCITWINRILFIKLLEGQLVSYHKDKDTYSLLKNEKIKDFHALDDFFFKVLAIPTKDRKADIATRWKNIPYLNSSLFDPTETEREHNLYIKNLNANSELPVFEKTVLKDSQGKPLQEESIPILEYLFLFLDAYNFSSEGTTTIQPDKKTLINASVLGLVFEKINGYKDGSFFTPGVITMYMCKETITQAVIQKFNDANQWDCKDLTQLKNRIVQTNYNLKEANGVFNQIKICDPAVGSGHFLVSALNELIAIKRKLQILIDEQDQIITHYIEVENDELIITNTNNQLFQYNPNDKKCFLQKTLFHEKQRLIENCLFGVDINPNSVKICRLRLWIELLKNAYYKPDGELETLPNIDINIKCGNSLISRFDMDTDISELLKNSKWNIHTYRTAVDNYKNNTHKQEKKELLQMIDAIKADFSTALHTKHPLKITLKNLQGKLFSITQQTQLYQRSKKEQADYEKQVQKISDNINLLEQQITTIETGEIYKNAFEWRFEFPEVLDEQGNFTGFDVVIGNPPYIQLQNEQGKLANMLADMKYKTFARTGDIYCIFYERGWEILSHQGRVCFITSNKWMRAGYGEQTRKFFAECTQPRILFDFAGVKIFDTATVDTNILLFEKKTKQQPTQACVVEKGIKRIENLSDYFNQHFTMCSFSATDSWVVLNSIEQSIKQKIEKVGTPLKDWDIQINYGIKTGYNDAFIIDKTTKEKLINEDHKSAEIIRPILRGRDIKKYSYEFADLYLINTHNGIKEKGIKPIDINEYPAIKKHLDRFYIQLEKRQDKGDTPYNLRNCAYMEDFYKQKVMWKIIGCNINFCYDDKGVLANNAINIMTGNNSILLQFVGLMNSRLFDWYLKLTTEAEVQGGGIQLYLTTLLELPLKLNFCETFTQLILDKSNGKNISEEEINREIYKLFLLTNEEINFIESL